MVVLLYRVCTVPCTYAVYGQKRDDQKIHQRRSFRLRARHPLFIYLIIYYYYYERAIYELLSGKKICVILSRHSRRTENCVFTWLADSSESSTSLRRPISDRLVLAGWGFHWLQAGDIFRPILSRFYND